MPRTPPRNSTPTRPSCRSACARRAPNWKRNPDAPLLDFDTGAELLYRFIDDLHAYAATYASLAVDTHERERWIERYEPKTNAIAAGVAGLRAAIVMMVLGAFWIATAWPSGSTLMLNAAAVCALASSSPNPKRTAFQMAGGTLVASVMGMIAVTACFRISTAFRCCAPR